MKLLFTSHSSDTAGAEQSLVHLVKEAAARGHSGTVALPSDGPLVDRLKPFSASFQIVILRSRLWMGRRYWFPVGLVRLLQALSDIPGYVQLLKRHDFDAVVVNSSVAPAPLVAARIARVPSLLMIRESLMTNPMLRSALPKKSIRRLLSLWATDVVTISMFVAEQFKFSSTIIYPQVNSKFLEFEFDDVHVRNNHELRAVMFGTISPEKGQLDAVRAVGLARCHGTPVSLEIYGHGSPDDLATIQSNIAELGLQNFVTLKQPTTDVIGAYQSADVSIVCSKNEAFGKVTAESVLIGKPVIAYACGGTAEILAHGGGLSTDSTPEALSEALTSISADSELMQIKRNEARRSPIRGSLASSARDVLKRVELLGAS